MFCENEKIIWTGPPKENTWAEFLEEIDVSEPGCIDKAEMEIAVDSKYHLFINEKLAVFDGGLLRGPRENAGYYDAVDIKGFLKKGNNSIRIVVWYYGNGGRNNIRTKLAGLIYKIIINDVVEKKSGEYTLSRPIDHYVDSAGPKPSYLYGGDNITFDARISERPFQNSKVAACAGNSLWGELFKREIPLFRFSGIKDYDSIQKEGKRYICKLPYACHYSPFFKIISKEGVKIGIQSDRYEVNGGPGDQHNRYNSQRVEYLTKSGEQQFLALNWYFGEYVVYEFQEETEPVKLGYIESGYGCDILNNYRHSDQWINQLMDKCRRTLYVCMRDNFMDCPDRERGQWIGDVSLQSSQVIYTLSNSGLLLLKKAIYDFINFRRGNVLLGNVPGENSSELPSQSLNAISEIGMIRNYYECTKDKQLLEHCYIPMENYLELWDFKDQKLMPRKGDWPWFDHLKNIDKDVLENAWYYSALRNVMYFAGELDRRAAGFIIDREGQISSQFDIRFLKHDGYRSGETLDDRANAIAVLSGLCKRANYELIKNVLIHIHESTPYMEYYVLKALCEMGYRKEAKERMKKRYGPLINNENTTLWEDFSVLGSKNHAWSGGPLSIMHQYFGDENLRISKSTTPP